jgi:hypothetical protein
MRPPMCNSDLSDEDIARAAGGEAIFL